MKILSRGMLVFIATLPMLCHVAMAQGSSGNTLPPLLRAPSSSASQLDNSAPAQTMPLHRLYWHFLVQVNAVDMIAAKMTAEGHDGTGLAGDMQSKLKFSDAEFAPIRASSQRLSMELKALDEEFKTIRSATLTESSRSQLHVLATHRDTYIDDEIARLRKSLSDEKRLELETFMAQFFAPKTITYRAASSVQPPTEKEGTP